MYFSVDSATAKTIAATAPASRRRTVTVKYLPGEDYLYSPVASRKRGCSVERNRAKRFIREIMRLSAGVFPAGSYLIFVNQPCASLVRTEVAADITAAVTALTRATTGEHPPAQSPTTGGQP